MNTASITTTPIIEVTNLQKIYDDAAGRTVAVDDVSFTVQPGEIFGVLGPNGAGKTTTVECLAGLRDATGGTMSVLGVDPQHNPQAIREHVGIQFQQAEMHDKITVREALELFAGFYPNPAHVETLITLLGLEEKANATFKTLSGGQKQRLSIGLALVGRPKIAILDELTTGLDPVARQDTWELVRRVKAAGVTVLLVTHFMEEAERLCDRLVIIDHGKVIAEGSPASLIDQTPGTSTLEDVFVTLTRAAYPAVSTLATEGVFA
ncbi:MAG: ABC transporter ATP-binding protein [Cellulomonadaceae bacterium]|jgi:ABC-2 type transport system ATP-binding protein|nr:ABC transporter ATP-binding protein [Cellulomonadaceae bacterium]